MGVEMPVTGMVAAVLDRRHTVAEAVVALMSRPLKVE
jgi:glycerol-3-phosphate dehydrogenase